MCNVQLEYYAGWEAVVVEKIKIGVCSYQSLSLTQSHIRVIRKHLNYNIKMVEISLECIGLLIANRYVVGSTVSKSSKNEMGLGFTSKRAIRQPYNY